MIQPKFRRFTLLTPKMLLLRWDVWPFLILTTSLTAYYMSLEEDSIYLKLAIVASCFLHCLTYIFGHWSKKARAIIQYNKLQGTLGENLEKASNVYIEQNREGQDPVYSIVDFFKEESEDGRANYFFHFNQIKYCYNPNTGNFERLKPKYKGMTVRQLIDNCQDPNNQKSYQFYDSNILDIPVRPFWDFVRDQIMDPLSFFQLFSVFLWMLDDNRVFSLMILVMLLVSAITIAIQRVKTIVGFRSLSLAPHYVQVYRNQKWVKIPSYELKPMDIMVVEPGYKCKKVEIERMTDSEFMAKHIPFSSHLPAGFLKSEQSNVESFRAVPCDFLLLSGSCTVNESILTGESIPQIKDPAEYLDAESKFDVNKHKQSVIFCGTEIIQLNNSNFTDFHRIKFKSPPPISGCLGLVLRTGFDTSKGKLIRTVMSNIENEFIKDSDGLWVIFFLLICSLITSAYVLSVGLEDDERNKNKLFLRCILIITTVVPPQLPMILTLAVNNAILYLQKKRIYVTEPRRLRLGGKVDIVAFDKTGTLTSDKFTFEGIVDDLSHFEQPKKIDNSTNINPQLVLAGCHTLISVDGKLIGDPIELLFFQNSTWQYNSHTKEAYRKKNSLERVDIKHIYPFRSDLKRMSTKVVHLSDAGRVNKILTKGAPEVIQKLLAHVPQNYEKAYNFYTNKGFRVLALASRTLTSQDLENADKDKEREMFESKLEFHGFFVCNSPLKPDTLKNIQKLQKAKYRLLMITGDNLFTAANVGKQLNLGHNIMTLNAQNDQVFAQLENDNIKIQNIKQLKNLIGKNTLVCTASTSALPVQYLPFIQIFARTSPSEKEYIIKKVRELTGKYVLYAGDGTNDVGGLRSADVGIAVVGLSGLEEIVAKEEDIKKKEVEFNKKRQEIQTDMSIPFSQRMQKLTKLMKDTQQNRQQDMMGLSSQIKFGDACIAAPFTSKHSNSIYCVIIVIRQAISTLVTAVQTYRILAITSLLQAYALAEMNMESLKYSEVQTTVLGILGSINFYFFSNAKPVKEISHIRAPNTIFNFYYLLSVFGQIFIYLFGNYYALNHIGLKYMPQEDKHVNADEEFKPSFLNTVIFLFSAVSQSLVFLVNHGGEPHIQSLLKNKKHFRLLIIPLLFCFLMASNVIPDLGEAINLKFDKVPYEANIEMLKVFGFMVVGSYVLEKLCKYGQFKEFFGWF